MIWSSIAGWVLLAALCFAITVIFNFFLSFRKTSTRLLAVASNDFFDNANKLMQTPEDLPDDVLNLLNVMMKSMNNGDGSRALLKMVRLANSESKVNDSKPDLSGVVDSMRPELRDLFMKTVAGWLNYVTHRHVIAQILIHLELSKMAVRKHTTHIDDSEAGLSILSKFERNGVIC